MATWTACGAARDRIESVAEALAMYGRDRMSRCSSVRAVGIESVLEILACFCDEVAADLLDPFSRKRLTEQGPGGTPVARDLLAPRQLIRLLAPCARLFPYQIAAGSGVIGAFRDEAPRLARWLRRRRLTSPPDDDVFAAGWSVAVGDIDRHVRLQRAIELTIGASPRLLHRGDVVTGRFRVEQVDRRGLWVDAGCGRRGPIRVPAPVLGWFATGQEASLAFQQAVVGWTLLAASLPCRENELGELLATMAQRTAGADQAPAR